MTFGKKLHLAAVALAAMTVVPLSAAPAAAATPCRAIPVAQRTNPTQVVLVAGAYTAAGAIDVRLTCGVVRNGITVASRTDELVGPVAVVSDTVDVGLGSVTSCYVLRVAYADGRVTWSGSCP
jgi:hypothetical protein